MYTYIFCKCTSVDFVCMCVWCYTHMISPNTDWYDFQMPFCSSDGSFLVGKNLPCLNSPSWSDLR